MDAKAPTNAERQLPTAVQLHILSLLSPNDRALSGRLAFKAAAAGLSGPQHCTATLSQQLPPHAMPWAVEAGQQHVRQLPFRLKPQLLCTAANSGSEVNLGVAWEILQPSIFPQQQFNEASACPDPGVAAVRARHPQLLGWLVRHCPKLLSAREALRAAAQHCDLAGLQAAWEAVQHKLPASKRSGSITIDKRVLDAAAGSATGDAVAKMEWLLSMADYSLLHTTADAAVRSRDLGRLRWLRERGCPMDGERVLVSALQHADLAAAQWLVDEAGCKLPGEGGGGNAGWGVYMQAAAKSTDAVAKWQWLQGQGAPPLQGTADVQVLSLAVAAVNAGQADVLQHLLSLVPSGQGFRGLRALWDGAAASGSIPTVQLLLQAGATFPYLAYADAYQPKHGHEAGMAMIRWLATEAGVRVACTGTLSHLVQAWARDMPATLAGRADVLEAVRLAVGGEGPHDWVASADPFYMRLFVRQVHELGNLGLAQFLVRVTRFVPDRGTLERTAQGGCEALLEWLVQQHPGCVEGASPYVPAAYNGDRATLAALRRLGVPWDEKDTVANVMRNGCRSEVVVRRLVEHGAPVGSEEELEEVFEETMAKGLSARTVAWLRGLAAG